MFLSILSAALILTATAAPALDAEALPVPAEGEQFWVLGSTGIDCYRLPCPWRSVFRIDPDSTRNRPLSRHDMTEPPLLKATEADRARIEDAFANDGCVVAEAHFEGETLVVSRIAGECHHWFPRRPAE